MASNETSRIDPMSMPAPQPSKKKSINLMGAVEYEIDAISFDGAGVNTVNPKDKPNIQVAMNADFSSCFGEVRPAQVFKLVERSPLYLYFGE